MSYFAVVLAPSIRASFKLRNISLLQLSKINKNSCLKSLQLFSVIEYLMKFPELCSTENYAVKNPSIDSDLSQLSLCFSSNLFQTNKYKLSSALPLNKTSVLWLSKFIQQKHIIVGFLIITKIMRYWFLKKWVVEERNLNMQTNEKCWLLSVFFALIKLKMC